MVLRLELCHSRESGYEERCFRRAFQIRELRLVCRFATALRLKCLASPTPVLQRVAISVVAPARSRFSAGACSYPLMLVAHVWSNRAGVKPNASQQDHLTLNLLSMFDGSIWQK